MDLAQVSQWRNLAGKVGTGFCILAFLALLDGLIAQFREPPQVLKLLPGAVTEINGPLAEDAQGVQDLTYVSTTEHLQVSFEAVHKGYFLGGAMWRGRLTVSPQTLPGEYRLTVVPKRSVSAQAAPSFQILVYPDSLSRQKSLKSFIRCYYGISPFGVAGSLVPGILLSFGVVYLLSGKRDALMAQAGKAEIYRVFRREDDYEIRFGLGTAHGLGPGVRVNIYDEQGLTVGTARVEESSQTDSVAAASAEQEIKAGYLVSR